MKPLSKEKKEFIIILFLFIFAILAFFFGSDVKQKIESRIEKVNSNLGEKKC